MEDCQSIMELRKNYRSQWYRTPYIHYTSLLYGTFFVMRHDGGLCIFVPATGEESIWWQIAFPHDASNFVTCHFSYSCYLTSAGVEWDWRKIFGRQRRTWTSSYSLVSQLLSTTVSIPLLSAGIRHQNPCQKMVFTWEISTGIDMISRFWKQPIQVSYLSLLSTNTGTSQSNSRILSPSQPWTRWVLRKDAVTLYFGSRLVLKSLQKQFTAINHFAVTLCWCSLR